MKSILAAISLILFTSYNIMGQALWNRMFIASQKVYPQEVRTDFFGNIYSTGVFHGSVDFDPLSGTYNLSSSFGQVFVSKLNSLGSFQWAKKIGGGGSPLLNEVSLAADIVGNTYITGFFTGTQDFDPGTAVFNLTSAGNEDIFICKLDYFGNFVWAKSIGGTSWDQSHQISLSDNGNLYVTGFFEGTADFDPDTASYNLSSYGDRDIFLLCMTTSGDFKWVRRFGGPGKDVGLGVNSDPVGNAYATGYFKGTCDFDPGPGSINFTAQGWDDGFIVKLDSIGNLIWAKHLTGPSEDEGTSIAADPGGNVLVTGHYMSTVDLDPGISTYELESSGKRDVFVLKLDSAGDFVWAKSMGGNENDYAGEIAVDSGSSVYVEGDFVSRIDVDPGIFTHYLFANGGDSETFLCKLNSDGQLVWGDSFGGPYGDSGNGLCIDEVNKVMYSVGDITVSTFNSKGFIRKYTTCQSNTISSFYTGCDSLRSPSGKLWTSSGIYGDTIFTSGYCDTLVRTVTLNLGNTSFGSSAPVACQEFSSPSGRYTWTVSGNYIDTIINASGCDSIININLTIKKVDTTISDNGPHLKANQDSASSYQWIYCDSIPITGATNQFYTATNNGRYAVVISYDGCTDTSDCKVIDNIGISELFNSAMDARVYPNPGDGQFEIGFNQPLKRPSLRIHDACGKVVFFKKWQVKETTLIFNIADMPDGVYFIWIEDENRNRFYSKVVKQ